MHQIDICMTAALRPEILERTLGSIKKNMQWGGGFQLVVDIAPVGEKQYSQAHIASICRKHFSKTHIRALTDSRQAEALMWTWGHAESPFILQWEDDWELDAPIDLEQMINCMPIDMGILCFDRINKSVLNYPGYKGQVHPTDDNVFLRVNSKSLGGPPSVMRIEYVRQALKIIDGTRCLDLMSHDADVMALLKKWKIGIYVGADGRGNLVRDLGKDWKKQNGVVMKKNTPRGVAWLKK